MTFATSVARLPGQSAIPTRTRGAAARTALNYPDIVAVMDAAEVAPEYAALTLRDLSGARPVPVHEGAPATINGLAAWDFASATSLNAGLHVPLALGQDYFIAVAVNLSDTADTSAFAAASSTIGDDLFFGTLSGGALRLAQGASAIQYSAGTVTGTHVFWATRRASDGAAEVAMDLLSAPGSGVGTIATNHSATQVTRIAGGGSPDWELNGSLALAVIGNAYRGGASNLSWRTDVLGYLAERAGVTLGA